MKVNAIWAVYFSATDTTKKVVTKIATRLALRAGVPMKTVDFTLPKDRSEAKAFAPGDLVVFGTPVYAGRVPNLLIKYVASFRGQGALAVPVVCYGNRSYDDALMELRNTLEDGGFHTVAGAAFSCQHSFSQTQGAGRPDRSDLTVASGFADGVFKKVAALSAAEENVPIPVSGNHPVGPYYTPRDRNGTPIDIRKVKPKTSEDCNQCGRCIRECPLGSIDLEDCTKIIGPCMKCNRCVRHCKAGAKYFDDPNYLYHKTELEEQYSWPRKEPVLFL